MPGTPGRDKLFGGTEVNGSRRGNPEQLNGTAEPSPSCGATRPMPMLLRQGAIETGAGVTAAEKVGRSTTYAAVPTWLVT